MVELGKPCQFCKGEKAGMTVAEFNRDALCSLCFKRRLGSLLGKRKRWCWANPHRQWCKALESVLGHFSFFWFHVLWMIDRSAFYLCKTKHEVWTQPLRTPDDFGKNWLSLPPDSGSNGGRDLEIKLTADFPFALMLKLFDSKYKTHPDELMRNWVLSKLLRRLLLWPLVQQSWILWEK